MLFWIVAAAMTAAVTALVLTPLLRSRQTGGSGAGSRAAYDMEVYRDQLAELERDLARGVIDDRQAQGARTEISRRMLAVAEEGKREAQSAGASSGRGSRSVALALCVLIPVGALAVYIPSGEPNLPGQPFASRETKPENGAPAQVDAGHRQAGTAPEGRAERPSGLAADGRRPTPAWAVSTTASRPTATPSASARARNPASCPPTPRR